MGGYIYRNGEHFQEMFTTIVINALPFFQEDSTYIPSKNLNSLQINILLPLGLVCLIVAWDYERSMYTQTL